MNLIQYIKLAKKYIAMQPGVFGEMVRQDILFIIAEGDSVDLRVLYEVGIMAKDNGVLVIVLFITEIDDDLKQADLIVRSLPCMDCIFPIRHVDIFDIFNIVKAIHLVLNDKNSIVKRELNEIVAIFSDRGVAWYGRARVTVASTRHIQMHFFFRSNIHMVFIGKRQLS